MTRAWVCVAAAVQPRAGKKPAQGQVTVSLPGQGGCSSGRWEPSQGAAATAEFIMDGKSGACDVLTARTSAGSFSPGTAPSVATWCECLLVPAGNLFWAEFELL